MEAPRQPKLDARHVFLEHYNERTQADRCRCCDDINLKVFEGELVAIVGPSGCGKTTFLNAVDGLIARDRRSKSWSTAASSTGPDRTAPWCSSTTACFPGARSRRT